MITNFTNNADIAADPFNLKRLRNYENTHESDYNCGGYALETFSWYLPYKERTPFQFVSDTDVELNCITFKAVMFMLDDFEGELRIIYDLWDLNDDEYPIAFRLGHDDFHFCKRCDDGVWREKRGGTFIRRMDDIEVLCEPWADGRYDGPIILLAKKKAS